MDQNVRPSIKYLLISHWIVPSDRTNHLRKTKSKYQRRVDQSVVDLDYSTGKQGNCIEERTGNGHLYSLPQRGDVMAILSTGFGKSMIFTFFAMAKEETPSSKTCMISISPLKSTKDDQTS